jgi:hypothetical protein
MCTVQSLLFSLHESAGVIPKPHCLLCNNEYIPLKRIQIKIYNYAVPLAIHSIIPQKTDNEKLWIHE